MICFDCHDQAAEKILDYAKEYIIKPEDSVYLVSITKNEPSTEKEKMDWAIKKIPTAQPLLMMGDPRDKLLQISKEIGVDVIVMGSRSMKAIQKVLIGSVSSYIVNHSTCSVFIIK